jgi:translation elongation factor EF-G
MELRTSQIIKSVPLSEMFGYATDLRSEHRRGSFTMHFGPV